MPLFQWHQKQSNTCNRTKLFEIFREDFLLEHYTFPLPVILVEIVLYPYCIQDQISTDLHMFQEETLEEEFHARRIASYPVFLTLKSGDPALAS